MFYRNLVSWFESSWQLSTTQLLAHLFLPLMEGEVEEKKGKSKDMWVKIRSVYLDKREETVVITIIKQVVYNLPLPLHHAKWCPILCSLPLIYIYWA